MSEGGTMDDTTRGDDERSGTDDDVTDLLVEEVSIDGLCGVY